MDKIFIKGLKISTIIGIYDFEREREQPLSLDLCLYMDMQESMQSDDIQHTIDYHHISNKIIAYVGTTEFQLLESLAHNICKLIFELCAAQRIDLSIEKPQAVEQAITVGVAITRYRS